MGTAILDGLLASGIAADNIQVSTLSKASALKLKEKGVRFAFSVEQSEVEGENANSSAVVDADVIIVAVKPAYVLETLAHLNEPDLKPGALVISVAAGITIAAMEAELTWGNPVVRAMPNTPAIVGRAVTGIALGSRANEAHQKLAEELFATVGKTLVVSEDRIDALSTISGSGPAYVFYLVEQFVSAAKHQGFSDDEAKLLVNETFLGATELLVASGKDPAELRRQVTSPNGTTMQAIARMEKSNLDQMFIEATDAALARAREIAAGK